MNPLIKVNCDPQFLIADKCLKSKWFGVCICKNIVYHCQETFPFILQKKKETFPFTNLAVHEVEE